jgi:hypothetical protein
MKLQEVAGGKIWSELRRQIDFLKPKTVKPPTPKALKKLKGNNVERTTARLSSAVAKLKPKSPIKPVQMARPGKATS